jgi:DNA-binding PadR family transcriptional regulator
MHRAFFRHAHGHGPWAFWGLGHRDWGGRRGGPSRPMRRGEVRYVLLELLAEGPKHGYELISAIEARRNVRPSAGSIYPTLQLLEDGGFVTSEQIEGKRVYTISDAGRELLANRVVDAEEDEDETPDARHRLHESAMKLGAAMMSARGSDDATVTRIRDVLDRARKEIYTILASDET